MGVVASVNRILNSDSFTNLLLLVCRLFLSCPFIIFGVRKYFTHEYMMGVIERAGVPGEVVWLVIPYQVLCGLAILTGFKTRLAAFLLGGFCIVATLLYHTDWSRIPELTSFTKDFATAGGFGLLWRIGPGKYSLDALFSARRQGAPAEAH